MNDAALLHCWRAAAPPGSDALARELLDRWREPHRYYHTLAHLAAMLAIVRPWPVVELAVWFHDAVYDPRATDNEEASAELAERSLPAVGAAPATVAEVARLVRLTATHDSAPGDGAGALLCDADLSILAADDPRLAAAVIQNPFVDGRAVVAATLRPAGRARAALLAWQGLRDETRRLLGRTPHRIALAGRPGSLALMTTPDAAPGYASILPPGPGRLRGGDPRPPGAAPGRRPPCPTGPTGGLSAAGLCLRPGRARPPRTRGPCRPPGTPGELRRYPIGHFDLFGGHWLEEVVGDQLAFLRRSLLDP